MSENKNLPDLMSNFDLEKVIVNALKVPGVKVNRKEFLTKTFASEDVNITDVIERGPIDAGLSRELLAKVSKKLILNRTTVSSGISFMAGMPGGFAMAATIPADVMQFFGMALRLAQELAYIYGEGDLWENGQINDDKINTQMILYCGVMFGAAGAEAGVRVIAGRVAMVVAKKLPQKALTKTFWYPIVKQIGKAVGLRVTKTTVASGVGKAIPVIGGAISGTLNFASMYPMAQRLLRAFDEAKFDYTEDEFNKDIIIIEGMDENGEPVFVDEEETDNLKSKVSDGINAGVNVAKNVGNEVFGKIKGFSKKIKNKVENIETAPQSTSSVGAVPASAPQNSISADEIFASIEKLAKLKEMGVLTQEEFDNKKTELLSRL